MHRGWVPALAEVVPWNQLPGPVRRVTQALLLLIPPVPDPGAPLQLVHHDDVTSAIALAGDDHVRAVGGLQCRRRRGAVDIRRRGPAGRRPVRVRAGLAAVATSEVMARLPFVPSVLEWLHARRTSVVMNTGKARGQLGWTPRYPGAEALSSLANAFH